MSTIAVIGAGFAGLAAAYRLADAGRTVTVFEARDRVGGRVWSHQLPTVSGPHVIERGGEFVLPGYQRMHALIDELGLGLVETGMSYYVREPGDSEVTAADITAAGARAAEILAASGPEATAEDILQRLDADTELVEALRSRIELSTSVRSSVVTARTLEHVASFVPLPSYRIAGGNQSLAIAIADRLGEAVRLGTPVAKVEPAQGGGVVVTTTAERSERFDAAIVAVPISVLRSGAVQAPTTDAREAALDGVLQGDAVKLHVPLAEQPPASAIMSVPGRYWTWTAIDAEGGVAPVLHGFMGSAAAIDRSGVANDPSEWLDSVQRLRPDLVIEGEALTTVWSRDPYAQGGYTAHAPSFTDADAATLEAPVGDIHFAGEYTEPVHTGLMEGALRSGERAAQRVTAALPVENVSPR